jgi:hypothetical protein
VGASGEKGVDENIDLDEWRSADNATGYKGVKIEGRRYTAQIRHEGKNRALGVYDTAEEAALAYAREHIQLRGEPEHREAMSRDEAIAAAAAEGIDLEQWRSSNSVAGYKGVKTEGSRYRARIRHEGERKYLGTYATAEEAALVVVREHIRLHGETDRREPNPRASVDEGQAEGVGEFCDADYTCSEDNVEVQGDDGTWHHVTLYRHAKDGNVVLFYGDDEYEGIGGEYSYQNGVLKGSDGMVIAVRHEAEGGAAVADEDFGHDEQPDETSKGAKPAELKGKEEEDAEASDDVVLETSSTSNTGFAGVYYQNGGKSFLAFLSKTYVGCVPFDHTACLF